MAPRVRMFLAIWLGILFVAVSSSAQSNADVEKLLAQLDNGTVTANVYENKVLGLRLRFPKTMAPDAKATLAADTQAGITQMREGRSKADQRLIDEMIRKDRIVFSLDLPESRESLGAAMSLTIKKDETREPLGPMVNRTIKFFLDDGRGKLIQGPSETTLGPLTVISFSFSQIVLGNTVFSKMYTGRRNGYLLSFSISYADEKGLSEMDAVVKAIEGIQ